MKPHSLSLISSLIVSTLAIAAGAPPPPPPSPARPAPLPLPLTSFGAAVLGDAFYIFGGHSGSTHRYSRATTHGELRRFARSGAGWQTLSTRERAQGASLLALDDTLICVGGMSPGNTGNELQDLRSLATVGRFNPATRTWTELPPLPAGLSSHDAVLLDHVLYVAGGWTMRGRNEESVWNTNLWALDLNQPGSKWHTAPQPFRRRALALAVHAGKVFCLGGMTPNEGTSVAVDVYDPATGRWTAGPALPEDTDVKGFGVAAAVLDGRLYASGRSGIMHRLSRDGLRWENAGRLNRGRIFHRLLPDQGRLYVVGGTAGRERVTEIEVFVPPPTRAAANWPGFRGEGNSVSSAAELPWQWSAQTNVRWRNTLPGAGQSSPVIWRDQVVVSGVARPRKERLLITAHDLRTGAERWRFQAESSHPEEDTNMRSRGAPTPVTDGNALYALFESGDVFALDPEGRLRWRKALTADLGPISGNHGLGASPILAGGHLIILLDQQTPSCLAALDRATGALRWRVNRGGGVSWSTPIVVKRDGEEYVIVSGAGTVTAYEARTGRERWRVEGLERNLVPSPTWWENRLFIGASVKGSNLALDWHTNQIPLRAWTAPEATCGFASPLVYQGRAYFISKAGVLYCHEAATGRSLFDARLPEGCWASPVGANGRIFLFGERGATTVLAAADDYRVLATNSLPTDHPVHGVAATEDGWVLRSHRQLICIGDGDSRRTDVSVSPVADTLSLP